MLEAATSGCKDIIAVPGFPTQWGSGAFKGQVIETEADFGEIARLGCTHAQGYLFSRPVPAEAVRALIDTGWKHDPQHQWALLNGR